MPDAIVQGGPVLPTPQLGQFHVQLVRILRPRKGPQFPLKPEPQLSHVLE